MKPLILLADDSVTIQKVIELTLMDEYCDVISVGDGKLACQEIEKRRPSLVIADICMPEKNGFEVCAFSKKLHPTVPVMLLVGTFETYDEAQFQASEADGLLKKPFDSRDALASIEFLLSGGNLQKPVHLHTRRVRTVRATKSQVLVEPPPPKPSHIFISYRRSDSADVTGRMYDRLVGHYGRERVFKDVDSIPLGANFKKHIETAVAESRAVIAVIGRRWLSDDGASPARSSLSRPRDFVRIELESALLYKIPIIPAFVGGATVPPEEELPGSLAELCYLNGIEIRHDPDFHKDVDRLIAGLDILLKANHPKSS